ncbi:MAG TPA: hypothetical protein VID27_15650 [Blastocatellia bacterium]
MGGKKKKPYDCSTGELVAVILDKYVAQQLLTALTLALGGTFPSKKKKKKKGGKKGKGGKGGGGKGGGGKGGGKGGGTKGGKGGGGRGGKGRKP